MSVLSGSDEFSTPIERRYWLLMENALKKKLRVCLRMAIDSRNITVLHIQIFPIDRNPTCLFSEYDLNHSVSLYFKAERFVKEYGTTPPQSGDAKNSEEGEGEYAEEERRVSRPSSNEADHDIIPRSRVRLTAFPLPGPGGRPLSGAAPTTGSAPPRSARSASGRCPRGSRISA